MIDGINNDLNFSKLIGSPSPATSDAPSAGGASFADALNKSIDEVSRLQQDASKAVEDIATGKTDDVNNVMTAVEKSDLAFKTLLAIRAKLMDAYEEIKGISI
jgi:flagellar hook-basal body complex protein FliE